MLVQPSIHIILLTFPCVDAILPKRQPFREESDDLPVVYCSLGRCSLTTSVDRCSSLHLNCGTTDIARSGISVIALLLGRKVPRTDLRQPHQHHRARLPSLGFSLSLDFSSVSFPLFCLDLHFCFLSSIPTRTKRRHEGSTNRTTISNYLFPFLFSSIFWDLAIKEGNDHLIYSSSFPLLGSYNDDLSRS
jgi:hypothetical protein